MLKWLRDKLMKGDEETFNIGLDRNTIFKDFLINSLSLSDNILTSELISLLNLSE